MVLPRHPYRIRQRPDLRHRSVRGLEFFLDSPEFRCVSLRPLLLRADGAYKNAKRNQPLSASPHRRYAVAPTTIPAAPRTIPSHQNLCDWPRIATEQTITAIWSKSAA